MANVSIFHGNFFHYFEIDKIISPFNLGGNNYHPISVEIHTNKNFSPQKNSSLFVRHIFQFLQNKKTLKIDTMPIISINMPEPYNESLHYIWKLSFKPF